jgi:CheY-like chemotaxis protein
LTKILVIEDESALREDICTVLTLEGFEVVEAPNGKLGIEYALREQPDLILCDIMMPECNGYEVLEAVRSQVPTSVTPFIFLTARTDRTSMREGMNLGADDYLTKPFKMSELLSAVVSRLERHTQYREISTQELDQKRKHIINVLTSDLRTPLVSLISMQDMITWQIGKLSDEQLNEMLRMVRSGSHHVRHVVEQMIFAAQIEMGTLNEEEIQRQSQPTYVFNVIETAINLARGFTKRNGDTFVRLEGIDRTTQMQCHRSALQYSLAEFIAVSLNCMAEGSELVITQLRSGAEIRLHINFQLDFGVLNTNENSPVGGTSQPLHVILGTPPTGIAAARAILKFHGGSFEVLPTSEHEHHLVVHLPLAPVPTVRF